MKQSLVTLDLFPVRRHQNRRRTCCSV